ncbi:MAG: hypothetical protein HQK67_12865 [Desulfamplus sp.]|nr:hypothetical protein [Desulfamplus sp.]
MLYIVKKNAFIITIALFTLICFKTDAQQDNIILTSTSPDTTISAGSCAAVYGTAQANHVTIESGANVRLINFPGRNTITIKSDQSLFTVYRSGAAVIFEGTDGTYLKIPATQTVQSIIFDNSDAANSEGESDIDKLELSLIITSGKVMIGEQTIEMPAAKIEAASDILESRPAKPQLGINFIGFYMDDIPTGEPNLTTYYLQPDWIFNDFKNMGIQVYRQFVRADLLWDIVEPQDDQWYFDEADAVIPNLEFEPIVTLFAMQYASGTPPWETESANFQKTLGDEAKEYLEKVIERYGKYVKYWELGNEMDHWRAYDPNEPPVIEPYPNLVLPPSGGFSPQEQGLFLSQAAAFIKERDSDAVIVMPGISGLDGYQINEWLPGIIEGGGDEWFDVINYHYYPEWQFFSDKRELLQIFIDKNGLQDKAVWLTETGSTASETLTIRTDYPNTYESQAADIFRRIIPAYAMGDSLVLWHTYIDSKNSPTNNWRLYGVRSDQGEIHPSYYALQLLSKELLPFDKVETISADPKGINSYKATTDSGGVCYVVWGEGDYTIPEGLTQTTGVIPNADGSYTWESAQGGDLVSLTSEPLLFK